MYLILREALAEVGTFYTWRFSIRLGPSQDFNDTQSRNEAGKLGSNICCALHDSAIFIPPCFPVFTVHLGYECMCVFQVTSAVSLCNPMDCSPPGSSVHGILQEEYWSGLSCPPLRDLPDPGIESTSLCLLHWQAGSLPLVPPGKPRI